MLAVENLVAGYGRTGELWGFARWGVIPDVVTLGKPMATATRSPR